LDLLLHGPKDGIFGFSNRLEDDIWLNENELETKILETVLAGCDNF
jgi:hypothetical protein